MKAKLLDIINRIYEIQLARLELLSLGATEVNLDFDNLELRFKYKGNVNKLKERVSWLESINNEPTWIVDIINANRKILYKYADLWFSNFVYNFKARFRPPLARSAINIVCPENKGIILDPFTGSGTTNVEATLLGLDSIGVDINPFYTTMTKAKYQFYRQKIENEEFALKFWDSLNSGSLFQKLSQQLISKNNYHPLFPIIYSSFPYYIFLCYLYAL